MNIEGLSEGTLEKLIGRGWIHSYLDIYRLDPVSYTHLDVYKRQLPPSWF